MTFSKRILQAHAWKSTDEKKARLRGPVGLGLPMNFYVRVFGFEGLDFLA
jgi:hypothetical protein